MSMQVSWNNRAASVGYAKQAETDGKQPTTWSMTAGQDQITISPEARAAYANLVSGQAALESSSQTAAKNDSDTQGNTTFPNPLTEAFNRITANIKKLQDYYYKQAEENMKYANPQRHIDDKYKNEDSPHFRHDMTPAERENAWEIETRYHLTGRMVVEDYPNNYAYRILGFDSDDYSLFNSNLRGEIETSIGTLLDEHGIDLPEDTSFRLTIDPYDYRIHVGGLEDRTLAQRIEDALNQGENGYNLYYYLWLSDPEKATANAATYKTGLYHLTKQLTGYNMRELQSGDGHFYLPDGRELWSVLEELVNGMGAQKAGDIGLEQYHHTYTYLGLRGWDGAPDADLSIDYVNGQLKEVSDEPVQSENTDTEEPAPPEEPNPEEEFAFTDPNYGLWMLEDGKFHHYQVPITKADLQQMADEIRNGKAPVEPVWTNSKAD